jgi:hypothetical protein
VRQVTFSCFASPNSFSAVPRATGPVLLFCAPGLVLSGNKGVRSRFHVLRSRIHFGRYRGRSVPFLYFARPNSFPIVQRASGLVFMFFATGLVFGGTAGVDCRLHVLCSRTRFRRYQGRRHPFSCIARIDSFSAVPRVSGPVFKFCALRLDFHGTVALLSRFHVLRARTHFRSFRVRRGPFSCFVRPDSFSTVPRATGSVFMYCATRLVFSLTRFHVFAPEVVSRGTEGVRSCFQVLRSRTRFWRYDGHWVPFSCFARPD